MRWLLLWILLFAPGLCGGAQCTSRSGPGTAALVELYTSEGCSSCPPADRWLASLADRSGTGSVVPLALHVDYWDYIGRKDPYAKREVALRQRKLTQLQRMAFVYTPQVMLQGRDFRGWGGKAFDQALARINAQPARASLSLTLVGPEANSLQVEAVADVVEPSGRAALYLAAYRSAHHYVVLEWQGPFPVVGNRLTERRKLPMLPGATSANSGVAAFVQERRSGEVLQALLRAAC